MDGSDMTCSRAAWKNEIEEWLRRLKTTEKDLGLKEKELRQREIILHQREKSLEEQFHVVQLESYDVNMWRDVDVQQWILQLGSDGRHNDLTEIAELFVRNAVTGHRLLLLTFDNLCDMGIQSIGHAVELYNEIQTLKAHNYRLQNFPPLSASCHTPVHSEVFAVTVTLMIGCHIRQAAMLEECRWKLYFELDCDDDNCDLISRDVVKHVTLDSSRLPGGTVKLTQPQFVMDRWITGITPDLIIDCLVVYEDRVRRPRSSKLVHCVDASSPHAATQINVPLNLSSSTESHRRNSPIHMTHSVSSPMLQEAWSMRNLEHAVPPPSDTTRHAESVWSGVVSGTQAAVLPAYRPHFHPVPLLHTVSNIDVVRPSTPPSKQHSHSPSSSSIQLSCEAVTCDQDQDTLSCDARHLSPGPRCPAAADNTLQREESSDSGGVFLTPPSYCSQPGLNADSDSNSTMRRNSRSMSTDPPATSLVNVGRTFGRLSSGDNADVECRAKVFSIAGGSSRDGSPGEFRTVDDTAERPANDVSDVVHVRSNSCYRVLYHRSDEPFVTPTKTKKKTKKPRRNSQPAFQTSCSSAKSMAVYGGNPKWIWKS